MVSEIWVLQSLAQVLPDLTSLGPWASPYGANGQITIALHNYRSRQVHETLNGVNPSSSFRDMRSAKSGSNMWQIWQVFSPWASQYGANGPMTMTVHNYRPRHFHKTSNGENPPSGYRDMGSPSLAAACPPARPPEPWRQYPSSPEGWGVKVWHHKRLSWGIHILRTNLPLIGADYQHHGYREKRVYVFKTMEVNKLSICIYPVHK